MRKTRQAAISRMPTTLKVKVTISVSRSFKKPKFAETLRVVDRGTDRQTDQQRFGSGRFSYRFHFFRFSASASDCHYFNSSYPTQQIGSPLPLPKPWSKHHQIHAFISWVSGASERVNGRASSPVHSRLDSWMSWTIMHEKKNIFLIPFDATK